MNWEIIIVAGIASIAPTLVAAAAFVQALRTHKAVNSRMTELLELTRSSASANATLAEKQAETERQGKDKKIQDFT